MVPSEGSHATFAPRGWKQRALQDFAEQELGQHCEVEHVACGSGLQRIYRFLDSEIGDASAPPRVQHVRCARRCILQVQLLLSRPPCLVPRGA